MYAKPTPSLRLKIKNKKVLLFNIFALNGMDKPTPRGYTMWANTVKASFWPDACSLVY